MSIDLGMPLTGIANVPQLPDGAAKDTKKDYVSDQDVRWCPGCGDYSVLSTVQSFLPTLGIKRENVVFVSGIGCSSRFPYYMNTYGLHSIHGRAPAIATGLATARGDLSVWVATGDGDALSIGGNHLIHALRRNVNIKILLFNNEIYGLTKGQYSPTSRVGTVSKSSPVGSVDTPFNPVSLALGAEATFVGRALDSDRQGLTEVLQAAAMHRGSAFVEIYQNCVIFNDGVFDVLKDPAQAPDRLLRLRPDEEVGNADYVAVWRGDGSAAVVPRAEADPKRIIIHHPDAKTPSAAFALSRLGYQNLENVCVGVFRDVERPVYDDLVRQQIAAASSAVGATGSDEDLAALLRGRDTWVVE